MSNGPGYDVFAEIRKDERRERWAYAAKAIVRILLGATIPPVVLLIASSRPLAGDTWGPVIGLSMILGLGLWIVANENDRRYNRLQKTLRDIERRLKTLESTRGSDKAPSVSR